MPAAPVGMTYRHLGTMEHNVCDILAQRMKHNKTSWTVSRPAFAGKAAIMVTTSGSGSSNHSLLTMDIALRSWGFHIAINSVWVVPWGPMKLEHAMIRKLKILPASCSKHSDIIR
jgi:hypothetical protein